MTGTKKTVLAAIRLEALQAGDRAYSEKTWLNLGGKYLELRFATKALKERLLISVSCLECPKPGKSDLTIYVWTEDFGEKEPAFCRPFLQDMLWRGGSLFFKESVSLPFLFDGTNKYFTAFDEERREGYYCLNEEKELPFLHICHPFRQIFHWWTLDMSEYLLVHAAVVGLNGTGVGLVAVGGSGKSTTAISALSRGLEFAGDDYVLFSQQARRALLVYSTGYLNPDMLALMPEFAESVIGRDPKRNDKTLIDLTALKSLFVKEMEVCALLHPVVGYEKTRIKSSENGMRVATALAASTTIQNEGWMDPDVLRKIFRCIKGIPIYEFQLSQNFAENAECLRNFILKRSGSNVHNEQT